MTLYCGIDRHANNNVVAVLDNCTIRFINSNNPMIRKRLLVCLALIGRSWRGCAVEFACDRYSLVYGFLEAGFPVAHRAKAYIPTDH